MKSPCQLSARLESVSLGRPLNGPFEALKDLQNVVQVIVAAVGEGWVRDQCDRRNRDGRSRLDTESLGLVILKQ
jgi:hypothetical protein